MNWLLADIRVPSINSLHGSIDKYAVNYMTDQPFEIHINLCAFDYVEFIFEELKIDLIY